MKEGFASMLEKLMRQDKTIVLIVADTGWAIFHDMKKVFPDRCFNFGICEQSVISIAAGMALMGLKPYVYAITSFLIERPFEQVKLDIVANNANVKLISYFNNDSQGITHYTKDIEGLCRILGLQYLNPQSLEEIEETIVGTYKIKKPCFVLF